MIGLKNMLLKEQNRLENIVTVMKNQFQLLSLSSARPGQWNLHFQKK